jgi:hypothetical protein
MKPAMPPEPAPRPFPGPPLPGGRSAPITAPTGAGDDVALTVASDASGPSDAVAATTGLGVATTGLAGALAVGLAVGFATVLAVGLGVDFAIGFGVGAGVGFGVGLGVGFGVGFGVGTGVGVGVGVGVGAGPTVNDPPATSQVNGGVTVCVPGVTRKIVLRVPFVNPLRVRE